MTRPRAQPSSIRGPAVTEPIDRRAAATRLHIIRAASRQFARRPYALVSLDDILADAEVTKGAMYFHFRSKHALALAIIDHQSSLARAAADKMLALKLSGLETLVDISYAIAVDDLCDDAARAGLNLLASIGNTDRIRVSFLGEWMKAFAEIFRRAISEGDVADDRDAEGISRLLVSMYLGIRQTSDLNQPERFLQDLQQAWLLVLSGVANPDRMDYLTQFIRRRTALAISRAAALRRDAP
jgi:AcrR family transcriptional regulator